MGFGGHIGGVTEAEHKKLITTGGHSYYEQR